jgi:hypothetical protein
MYKFRLNIKIFDKSTAKPAKLFYILMIYLFMGLSKKLTAKPRQKINILQYR